MQIACKQNIYLEVYIMYITIAILAFVAVCLPGMGKKDKMDW